MAGATVAGESDGRRLIDDMQSSLAQAAALVYDFEALKMREAAQAKALEEAQVALSRALKGKRDAERRAHVAEARAAELSTQLAHVSGQARTESSFYRQWHPPLSLRLLHPEELPILACACKAMTDLLNNGSIWHVAAGLPKVVGANPNLKASVVSCLSSQRIRRISDKANKANETSAQLRQAVNSRNSTIDGHKLHIHQLQVDLERAFKDIVEWEIPTKNVSKKERGQSVSSSSFSVRGVSGHLQYYPQGQYTIGRSAFYIVVDACATIKVRAYIGNDRTPKVFEHQYGKKSKGKGWGWNDVGPASRSGLKIQVEFDDVTVPSRSRFFRVS